MRRMMGIHWESSAGVDCNTTKLEESDIGSVAKMLVLIMVSCQLLMYMNNKVQRDFIQESRLSSCIFKRRFILPHIKLLIFKVRYFYTCAHSHGHTVASIYLKSASVKDSDWLILDQVPDVCKHTCTTSSGQLKPFLTI